MPDTEQVDSGGIAPDPSEEAAASKLWAVYVSEADKYDRSLVESWKSDMEGMLIFAGLFSASLTAFIIESYKSLIPDSGDSTVQLLSRISQQLAAAANGSNFEIPAPTQFSPSTSSLVCNALWFISLALSLTCALIATLLEQWARNFLHKTDMRSAPVIRARIFSYLYYGLRRFHMHTIVDIIPMLLHASLVFFFSGLVAFLIPINIPIAAVAAALLAVVVTVYFLLTLLPLWHLDCPYRTPLSATFWGISQCAQTIWRRRHRSVDDAPNTTGSSSMETMVEAMSHQAMELSPARTARDYRALVWTVKSLADETELEPFIEAIPDVLWGPTKRRYAYESHIQNLMRHPHLQLQSRVTSLLHSCRTGLLSEEARKRRQIACYKTLWAVASVHSPLDFSRMLEEFSSMGWDTDPATVSYSSSAVALMVWSTFCFVRSRLAVLTKDLEADVVGDRLPDFQPIKSYLHAVWGFGFHFNLTDNLQEYIDMLGDNDTIYPSGMVPEWIQAVKNFSAKTPYKILFDYFTHLASLESPPYRWWETRAIISLENSTPFSALENDLERALERVIARIHPARWATPNVEFIDLLMTTLCSFWRPDTPTPIPRPIIHYINERKAESALQNLLTFEISELWDAFPITLATRFVDGKVREQEMMALWRVASLEVGFWPDKYRPVLEAMASIGPSESPLTLSVITMIKTLVVDSIQLSSNPLEDSSLPTETAIVVPPDINLSSEIFQQIVYDRIMEAKIALLADFLDKCSADFIPFKAVETIRCMCDRILVPRGAVHESHQLRLTNAMIRLLNPVTGTPHGFALLETAISCQMFELYAGLPDSGLKFGRVQTRYAWFENPIARGKLRDTLVEFIADYPPEKTASSAPFLARAQVIVGGLDSLHIN